MTSAVLVGVISAVASSVLTVTLLILAGRWYRRRRLDALLAEAGEVLARRARDEVGRAVEEALPRLREEVRRGFEDAAAEILPRLRGEVEGGVRDAAAAVLPDLRTQVRGGLEDGAAELLPRLRAEVKRGFREGLTEALSGGLLVRAGDGLARKGTSVLEAGLKAIFGPDDGDEQR